MRRAASCFFLTLILPAFLLPAFLLAQHSTSSSSASSGSSSSTTSSGSSGSSGSYSGGSHSSGSSSSASSSSSSGGSWHSSSGSSYSIGAGHSGSVSSSSSSQASSSSTLSELHPSSGDTHAPETKSVTDRPGQGVNQPSTTPARTAATTPQQKAAQKPNFHHRLFSFLRKNPPCRGNNCPPQPPCRTKHCPVTCPSGQVVSGSSCVATYYSYANDCVSGYDPTGRCNQKQSSPCTGYSAALAAKEQEVERLRAERELACKQSPQSQTCADLTLRYNRAQLELDQLRVEAARCPTTKP